ncbi:hypothetical protein B0H13DRAFT_1871044 [Mycena leptocephala]|nr:hypothetical protein B0H13DRAFT_1871044 [Mycena leptocephala]
MKNRQDDTARAPIYQPRPIRSDYDSDIRSTAANANLFGNVNDRSPFNENIGADIPRIDDSDIRSTAELFVKLIHQPASHENIKAGIPRIAAMLSGSSPYVRSSAAELFGKLIHQLAFKDDIRVEIPGIAALLGDKDSVIRSTASELFGKLNDQAAFHENIGAEIPRIVGLLSNNDSDIRFTAAELFVKLIHQPALHENTRPEIHRIVGLLSDNDSDIKTVATQVVGKLIDQSDFHENIGAEIPHIVALLGDNDPDIRFAATEVFVKLIDQLPLVTMRLAAFHENINAEIPRIVTLLNNSPSYIKSSASELFGKLIDQRAVVFTLREALTMISTMSSTSSHQESDKHSEFNARSVAELGKNHQDVESNSALTTLPSETAEDVIHIPECEVNCFLVGATGAEAHVASKADHIANILSSFFTSPDDFSITFGFDESLILAGDVLLQQILLHCPTLSDLHSQSFETLLAILGKEFSPYPGVIITPSGSRQTPVFHTNGEMWDLDDLALSHMKQLDEMTVDELQLMSITPASNPMICPLPSFVNNAEQSTSGQIIYANEGARDTSGMQDNITSGRTDSNSQSSSTGRGSSHSAGSSNNRISSNGGPADLGAGSSIQKSSTDKSQASGSGGNPSGPSASEDCPPAYFNACAEIASRTGKETLKGTEPLTISVFHNIRTKGTVQTTTERAYKDRYNYPVAKISFHSLTFQRDDFKNSQAVHCPERAYQQLWAKIRVASGHNHARIAKASPTSTPATSDGKRMDAKTAEKNSSITIGGKLAATFSSVFRWSVNPEVSGLSTLKKTLAAAQWHFFIGDRNKRENGLTVEEANLPTAEFHFTDLCDQEPPSQITLSLQSLWTKPEGGKTSKLEPPFQNIYHLVELKLPSNLVALYDYRQTRKADSQEERSFQGFAQTDLKNYLGQSNGVAADDEHDIRDIDVQRVESSTVEHLAQSSNTSAQADSHKEESKKAEDGVGQDVQKNEVEHEGKQTVRRQFRNTSLDSGRWSSIRHNFSRYGALVPRYGDVITQDDNFPIVGERQQLGMRERSFIRAILNHDYETAKFGTIYPGKVMFMARYPHTNCLTLFDYTHGQVQIHVLDTKGPYAQEHFGVADDNWNHHVARAARSSGRLQLDVAVISEGNKTRHLIVPLCTESSEINDTLRRIALESRFARESQCLPQLVEEVHTAVRELGNLPVEIH